MLTAVRTSPSNKQAQRKLLRAFNGAALGAVIGGLLGCGLGAASAFIVDALHAALSVTGETWSQQWQFCAGMGLLPAVPAGFLLGTSVIIRGDRPRLIIGAMVGLLVGIAYTGLWFGALYRHYLVMAAIVISGLVGGVGLTLILTAIRRHWKWWTRWEEEPLRA